MKGGDAIRKTIEDFFGSMKALRHQILETWFHDETVICHGQVTYARLDDSDVTIPFVKFPRM